MKSLHALVIVIVAAAGCATTAPAPHKYGVNNSLVGIETQTWYSTTADSGQQLVFGRAHGFVSCLAQTGTYWVKRHSPDETSGTPPSTPVPSANAVASGWGRITDGQTISWGQEGVASTSNEQTLFVDAWNQTTSGNLICVAH